MLVCGMLILRCNNGGVMDFSLIDDASYADYAGYMHAHVLPALDACRVEGWMEPAVADASGEALPALANPGCLHYLCYDAAKFDALCEPQASGVFRGAVVISHGFTEFAPKYSELVWYFLLSGYSVCILEHRGHGYSARDVKSPGLVWIDDWKRYVADSAKFASTIALQYADGRPLNLFSHSMGGGIGAAVLEQYPTLFDKAVLSAPMIAPQTGVPNWFARILAEIVCTCGFGRRKVTGQSDFDPEFHIEGYEAASEARMHWYHQLRLDDEANRMFSPTFEWVRQSLRLSRAVLNPESCAAIETPIMLFQAGKDVWVLNAPQNRFAERVREGGGSIQVRRFPDSLHEIFSMPNSTYAPYLQEILAFYDTPEAVVALK